MRSVKITKDGVEIEIFESGKASVGGKTYDANVDFDAGKVEILGICKEDIEAKISTFDVSLIGNTMTAESTSDCEAPTFEYATLTYNDESCYSCFDTSIVGTGNIVTILINHTVDSEVDAKLQFVDLIYKSASLIEKHINNHNYDENFLVVETDENGDQNIVMSLYKKIFKLHRCDSNSMRAFSMLSSMIPKQNNDYSIMFNNCENPDFTMLSSDFLENAKGLIFHSKSIEATLSCLNLSSYSNANTVSITNLSGIDGLYAIDIDFSEKRLEIGISKTKCNRLNYEDILTLIESMGNANSGNMSIEYDGNAFNIDYNNVVTHSSFQRSFSGTKKIKDIGFTDGIIPIKMEKFQFTQNVPSKLQGVAGEYDILLDCYSKLLPYDDNNIRVNSSYMGDDGVVDSETYKNYLEDVLSKFETHSIIPNYSGYLYGGYSLPETYLVDMVLNKPNVMEYRDYHVEYKRGDYIDIHATRPHMTRSEEFSKLMSVADVETMTVSGIEYVINDIALNPMVKTLNCTSIAMSWQKDIMKYYPTVLKHIDFLNGNNLNDGVIETSHYYESTNLTNSISVFFTGKNLKYSMLYALRNDIENDISKFKDGDRNLLNAFKDAYLFINQHLVDYLLHPSINVNTPIHPFSDAYAYNSYFRYFLKGRRVDFIKVGVPYVGTTVVHGGEYQCYSGIRMQRDKADDDNLNIYGVREVFELNDSATQHNCRGAVRDIKHIGYMQIEKIDGEWTFVNTIPLSEFSTPTILHTVKTVKSGVGVDYRVDMSIDGELPNFPTPPPEPEPEYVNYSIVKHENGAIEITWNNSTTVDAKFFTFGGKKVKIPEGGE